MSRRLDTDDNDVDDLVQGLGALRLGGTGRVSANDLIMLQRALDAAQAEKANADRLAFSLIHSTDKSAQKTANAARVAAIKKVRDAALALERARGQPIGGGGIFAPALVPAQPLLPAPVGRGALIQPSLPIATIAPPLRPSIGGRGVVISSPPAAAAAPTTVQLRDRIDALMIDIRYLQPTFNANFIYAKYGTGATAAALDAIGQSLEREQRALIAQATARIFRASERSTELQRVSRNNVDTPSVRAATVKASDVYRAYEGPIQHRQTLQIDPAIARLARDERMIEIFEEGLGIRAPAAPERAASSTSDRLAERNVTELLVKQERIDQEADRQRGVVLADLARDVKVEQSVMDRFGIGLLEGGSAFIGAAVPVGVALGTGVADLARGAVAIVQNAIAERREEGENRLNQIDEEADRAQAEAEESIDVDVILPSTARFPIIGATSHTDNAISAQQFVTTVLGASDVKTHVYNVDTGILTLTRATPYTVVWLFARVFGPLFKRWDEDGTDPVNDPIGTTPATLHTYYWMNTAVPFITQVILAFKSQLDALSRVQNTADGGQRRFVFFNKTFSVLENLARFVTIKALTGFESSSSAAGAAVQNEQTEHVRALSMFDDPTLAGVLNNSRTLIETLGVVRYDSRGEVVFEPRARTNNQLLHRDVPLMPGPGNTLVRVPAATVSERNRPPGTNGRVGAPIVKMVFSLQRYFAANGKEARFNNNFSRLFLVEQEGNEDAERVRFATLTNEAVPDAGQIFNSAMSYESCLSRIFTLPWYDALYSELLDLYGVDTSINGQCFSFVGGGVTEDFLDRYGAFPAFFADNVISEERLTSRKERAYQLDIAPLIDDTSEFATDEVLDTVVPNATANGTGVDLVENVQAPPEDDDEKTLFRHTVFASLLTQMANLSNLWGELKDTNARYIVAHRVIATLLFARVKLPGGITDTFFDRYGKRPAYTDDEGQTKLLPTAAQSRFTVSHARATVDSGLSLSSLLPRVVLKPLSKAIAGDKEFASQTYEFVEFMQKELGGKLAQELDSSTEGNARTVFVPNDAALDDYLNGGEYTQATRGLSAAAQNSYLYDVLQYHILSRRLDFERMLRERRAARVPTELVNPADKRVLRMEIEVLSYNDKSGGTLRINTGDDRRGNEYVISGKRRAKNGDYYIINRVIDVSRARDLRLEGRQINLGQLDDDDVLVKNAGEDLEVEDIYGPQDFEEEEEAEQRRVRFAEIPPSRLPPPPPMFSRGKANALGGMAQRQAKNLRDMEADNEADFAPMRRLLVQTGVHGEIERARKEGRHVYVLSPTRRALLAAGIDVDRLSERDWAVLREFTRRHVLNAEWENEREPGRRYRTPMTQRDLIYILDQQRATPITTFSQAEVSATLDHVPLSHKGEPLAGQVHIDDLELYRPEYIYNGDKDVPVFFTNRVLAEVPHFGGGAAEILASAAAPAPKASAGGVSATQWSDLVTATAKKLAKAGEDGNHANYHGHVETLNASIDKLGGAKQITAAVQSPEIDRSFTALRQAIARNPHVDTARKADAHDALDKVRARFPASK